MAIIAIEGLDPKPHEDWHKTLSRYVTTFRVGATPISGCAQPRGSPFLYARWEMQHLVEPLVVSWGWNRDYQTSKVAATSEASTCDLP